MKRLGYLIVGLLTLGLYFSYTWAFTGIVYEATVDGVPTITICNPDDDTECLTMMDRNLGASVAGIGADSDGYTYQWGNNYGFPSVGTVTTTGTKATWDDSYDNSGYYGEVYITSANDYWSDGVLHDNLWGGSGDREANGFGYTGGVVLNVTGRQGPCPEGYHVPSQGEWLKTFLWWSSGYKLLGNTLTITPGYYPKSLSSFTDRIAQRAFQDDFKIPFAGYRKTDGRYNMGITAELWSSTPNEKYERAFMLQPSNVKLTDSASRPLALSVRCFKDSALSPYLYSAQAKFESNGATSVGKVLKVDDVVISPSITRYGYEIIGWSTDSGAITAQYLVGDEIPDSNTTYYAITHKFPVCEETLDETVDTLTICNPDNTGECLTLMDKNLGASVAGIGPESDGCMYQWGNNYCFPSVGTVTTTGTLATWDDRFNNSGYYGEVFITGTSTSKYDYWSDNTPSNHNRLWGGTANETAYPVTNPTDRRGPCPEGYHVPSYGEWNKTVTRWIASNNDSSDARIKSRHFESNFLIPFAGYRNYSSAGFTHSRLRAYLWSSSPRSTNAWQLHLDSYNVLSEYSFNYRAYASSIRCFKDQYISPHSVTFLPNGATSVGSATPVLSCTDQLSECNPGLLTGCTTTVVMPSITRDGWTVLGWSTDSGATVAEYSVGETVTLSGDTTFYAITSKVYTATFNANGADSIGADSASCTVYSTQTSCGLGVGNITICNPANPGECLTMQDRNLGAGSAGTGLCSYGNYYQRGNNYGFPSTGSVITGGTLVDVSTYGPSNPFSGSIFIVTNTSPYDWATGSNKDNLWGGLGDDRRDNGGGYTGGVVINLTGRQGPCSEGYHVPSAGELHKIFQRWVSGYIISGGTLTLPSNNSAYFNNNSTAQIAFQNDFLIPFAVGRLYGSQLVSSQGADLWSSSPCGTNARYLYLRSSSVHVNGIDERANAHSVRCFKDISLTQPNKGQVSKISAPSITRNGYEVLGWSTDPNATVAKYSICDEIELTGDTTLYAITKPLTATFLPGDTFNKTIKSLATGATVTSTNAVDTLIQQVVRTGVAPTGVTTGLLSTNTSEVPVVGWFDNGVLYYYTEAEVIYLNNNSSYMFYNIQSGTYIDTSGWDTSSVTSMSYMFSSCSSLTSLDVNEWNTSSVTSMSYMFSSCSSLTSLDVSEWNTSNVTNMSNMFYSCSSLTSLDVSEWNTSNVTNMINMFSNCSSLTSLDVSEWNTSNVTNMSNMFYSCSSLTSLDVSEWNTSSVTNMRGMFNGCRSLTELDVSEWDTSKVTNMRGMFNWCDKLNAIYASTGFITSGVTSSTGMFASTKKLIGGHGTKWNGSYTDKTLAVLDSETQSGYLTYDIAVSYRTRSGAELTRQIINVGSSAVAPSITGYNVLGYYSNTGLSSIFGFSQELRTYTEVYVDYECATGYKLEDGLCKKILTATFLPGQTFNTRIKSLATGATVTDYTKADTLIQQVVRTGIVPTGVTTGLLSTNTSEVPVVGWFDDGVLYYYTEAEVIYLNQSSSNMFYAIKSGTYIDTSGWDTSSVTDMGSMFGNCNSLTELDVSSWDTSNVVNMYSMFNSCRSLEGLNVSEWDTSSVENMHAMFQYCRNLTGLDVSNWDTSNVVNMYSMFHGCSSLTNLDVSDWNTSNVTNMSYMFRDCSSLTSLDVSEWDTSSVENMHAMFHGCSSLTNLDVSDWNTSNVTNMSYMFRDCSSLTGLNVSSWDTNKVINMNAMFYGCSSLTGLNVTNFDTSSVTDMGFMFNLCSSLMGLDVSSWDTRNVTNMSNMFSDCSSLTGLDVSSWDTSNVTNMSNMFQSCRNLTGLDVSNWNTSSVTNMRHMFSSCSSLMSLDVSEWDTSSVENMQFMFYSCSNLKTIYASTGFITSGVTNSSSMFSNTPKLLGGHGTKWNILYQDKTYAVLDSETESGYLTYDIAVSYRTRSGAELTRQIINVGDTTVAPSITGYNVLGYYSNTGLSSTFDFSQELRTYTEVYVDYECATGYKLEDGLCRKILTAIFKDGQTFNKTIKSLATGATVTSTASGDTLIQQVVRTGAVPTGATTGLLSTNTSEVPVIGWFDNGILYYYTEAEVIYLNQDSSYMFNKIQSGTYIDTSGWDTSNVTTMQSMFGNCSSLTGLDVSSWDTSSVTTMQSMFGNCSSLTGLDVSSWNTSSVTNMYGMFGGCSSLEELDVSSWDTSSVTNMEKMFLSCRNLIGLDVRNWDTSNVTNMGYMFDFCSSLTGLHVSSWDTSNVTDMRMMFRGCSSLTELDVREWNTSKVTNMGGMFISCSSLTELDVGDWNTSKVTDMSQMFAGCSRLTELDVSNWDTSKVTNMGAVFFGCSSLTELDVSEWNTSNVIDMYQLFAHCRSLTGLDASGWDTSKVTNMGSMFHSCSSLMGLDVSSWDTSSVTNMEKMFLSCHSLTVLDVSSWDTSKVTNMGDMFISCISLTGLDLSNWNTSNVANMSGMFLSCINLKTIYASTGFTTNSVVSGDNMFYNTPKLIGGHGTKWTGSIIDKTRALLDSETQSGYLTYDIAVSYRTRSGAELARQIINVGDTTVAPSNIIRTGYAVSGWYLDTGYTTLFDFTQPLRTYTELYAEWKCDTGYMLSGDGVTCIPLTYTVRHFIKDAGVLSYTLSGTEVYTGIAGERVNLSDFSRTYPSCIVYSRGSLTGDESGPGVVVTGANIAGDGTTVLNLYYDRNTYTVQLEKDLFTSTVEGAGTYECGQEVQIRAYPIEGYHFQEWEPIGDV